MTEDMKHTSNTEQRKRVAVNSDGSKHTAGRKPDASVYLKALVAPPAVDEKT